MRKLLGIFGLVIGSLHGQTNYPLPFRVLDAEYSVPLNRIIMIGNAPSQLHIYDPATRIDVPVDFPTNVVDLSLSPDGQFAAVATEAGVAVVNLFSARIERTYAGTAGARAVALTGPTILATLPRAGFPSTGLATIIRSTGQIVTFDDSTIRDFSLVESRMNPSGAFLYSASTRLQLLNGNPTTVSPLQNNLCAPAWFSPDSTRVYSGCGPILTPNLMTQFDGEYRNTLPTGRGTLGVWETPGRDEVATITGLAPPFGTNQPDTVQGTEVRIFRRRTLAPLGRLLMAPTVVANRSVPTRARWLFGNGASELYVIAQADASGGLVQDFSLRIFDLDSRNRCTPRLASSTLNVGNEGAISTVAISNADCLHSLTPSAPWLRLLEEPLRAGDSTANLIVRPNFGAARSATVDIGGQTLTINQAANVTPRPNPVSLSYRLVAAEYSRTLNRAVIVSADVPELHIFDPVTQADQVVDLRGLGNAVSLDTAELQAIVSHDGAVSVVNLQTAEVTRVYEVPANVFAAFLGNTGFAYLIPRQLSFSLPGLYNVALATGSITPFLRNFFFSLPDPTSLPWTLRMQPASNLLRLNANNVASTADGPITEFANNSLGLLSTCAGSNFWFTETGDRLLASCGELFRTQPYGPSPLPSAGRLTGQNEPALFSASHHQSRQTFALLLESQRFSSPINDEVRLYADNGLALAGRRTLPTGSRGRFVFWNREGTALHVLTTLGSEPIRTLPASSLVIDPNSNPTGCTLTAPTTVSVVADDSTTSVAIATAPNCAWTASSSAPWLRINAGAFSFGPGSLELRADSNLATVTRSATITLSGGQSFTVIQQAAPLAVQPVTLSIPAVGDSRTLTVTTALPSTIWTATPNVPWITISSGVTGVGSGTISYQVAANPGAARSGLIRVNNINVSILQDSASANRPPQFVSATVLTGNTRQFVFSDPDGAASLGVVNILINRALDARAACYLAYDSQSGTLFLVNNTNEGLAALPAGATASVENDQCRIPRTGFSATTQGNTLTLTIPFEFKTAFTGDMSVYAAARDLNGANSGWRPAGVQRQPVPGRTLSVPAASPNTGTVALTSNTYSFTYEDSTATDQFVTFTSRLRSAQVLINGSLDGRAACYIGYDRAANRLYLMNDEGSQLLPRGIEPNQITANVEFVENAQCVLSSAGTTAVQQGATRFAVNLNLSFKTPFAGPRFVYAAVQTITGNSGWNTVGQINLQ